MQNNNEILKSIKNINVYNNGQIVVLSENDYSFNNIIKELNFIINNCIEMPAFGVTIHKEVVKEQTKGLWLELCFEKQLEHNQLPFDKLLINIERDWTGLNIIRHYHDQYQGRCFYINLINNTNLNSLYETLININDKNLSFNNN